MTASFKSITHAINVEIWVLCVARLDFYQMDLLHCNQDPDDMVDENPLSVYAALLPGVPHIESPFFERIVPTLGLSEEESRIAQDLFHKGYAILDFPDPDLDRKAGAIKSGLHGGFDWDAWLAHGHQNGVSLRAWDAWQQVPEIQSIASNPTIITLLSKLYGRQAWPFQTLNFPVGSQQPLHSDSVHFSCNPERFMCGVWVALEDVDLENGPLVYYPGSHKWPIFTNEHIGFCAGDQPEKPGQGIYEGLWRALVEVNGLEPEYFTCRKGQALIWAANLLHGGAKHSQANRTRWSQVTHYYFDNCAYYTPMWSDPFDGLIYFRSPIDIATGERRHSHYAGHPVSNDFVRDAMNGHLAFDPALYLAAHPDVAASGMSAWDHYQRHGRYEQRRLR